MQSPPPQGILQSDGSPYGQEQGSFNEDIIFITIAAVICGAATWNDIENYGQSKEPWLRQYLQLPNGIPSHDTFNRFFSALAPEAFEEAFIRRVKDVADLTQGEVVSMDGKSLRGTREGSSSKRAVHTVSAWANSNQLSLGQVKVDAKSNEITAVPKLLEVLTLQGSIVTIDAMGCQKEIASKIIEKEADCIPAVKGDQGSLEEEIERTVQFCRPKGEWVEEDFGHGRIESRKCSLYGDFSFIANAARWKELKGVVKIESSRYIKPEGKEETETRYYITGSGGNAEKTGKAIRSHWGLKTVCTGYRMYPSGKMKAAKEKVARLRIFL